MNEEKTTRIVVAEFIEKIIGIALAICLFAGALGFLGYVAAFCIGGETSEAICVWLYKSFYPALIKTATVTTLLVFVKTYIKGEAKWTNPFSGRKSEEPEDK